jgi:large conductance mechanosensitive channel
MLDGFKKFILRGNVVDMAVGVVIGAAFASVVGAFTKDLLTPLIGAIVGKSGDFATFSFTVRNSVFNVGDLINQTIAFLLVAAAVYFFVVLPLNALMARLNPAKEAAPTTKPCSECLSDIPIEAKRCAYCAQPVTVGRAA